MTKEKKKGRKEGSRKITSNIPLLQHSTRSKKTETHDEVISFLAEMIYRAFKNVNYDHITTTTPKLKEIPLSIDKAYVISKFDISFIYNNRLILIEIKTEEIKWQKS